MWNPSTWAAIGWPAVVAFVVTRVLVYALVRLALKERQADDEVEVAAGLHIRVVVRSRAQLTNDALLTRNEAISSGTANATQPPNPQVTA